ncbi:glutamate--tRNA ligase [Aquisalimonas lutea]|uniref:glutamate--tRNA ligase n=1 Tax=Aquisalimonas lutea TaxID=1327750 RepID=UPI0025B603DD|nr:glutamate--tRNA ligase [Aquisalimonas lutea]MDN3518816.1 glutamate--tRNA ligase [Aquisalimonas lutea]
MSEHGTYPDPDRRTRTRFAPSPTGLLHIGNLRTALFNALLARRDGGDFVLRIEDTDAERSRAEHVHQLCEDLQWLGLDWQEGPGVEGPCAPYAQSARQAVYDEYFAQLEAADQAYPCFCTQQELERARQAQRAAGKAPRYPGTCANLTRAERQARLERGLRPTLRFRVPGGRTVAFDDRVRGTQRFATDDLGDFIIRRADGTPAFFFSNAVDDALMGITHVLRGEDHVTNTPRQLLLLEALGLAAPAYGHISMITGADGAPLSKRNGSRAVSELRDAGFLPEAVVNHLARLGHVYEDHRLLDLDALADDFALERLGRAPARFDPEQLQHWQREAVQALSAERMAAWMRAAAGDALPADREAAFAAAVRDNVRFPEDVRRWCAVLLGDAWEPDASGRAWLRDAGPAFFQAAARAHGDWQAVTAAVKAATGRKGKSLFMPLRVALTGLAHGPELPAVHALLGEEEARRRFRRAAELAAGDDQ